MRFLLRVTVAAAALAVLTSACGSDTDPGTALPPPTVQAGAVTTTGVPTTGVPTTGVPTPEARSAPTGPPATTVAPADVPEQLRFSVAGVDGAQVVGADYAGKDVALWFWAPW